MENSIEIGNACSREKKYEEAIAQYSQAIVENPENPLIWRRRAMCYFKLSNWSEVVEDAKMVLFLDSRSVKGHFLMGSALLKMSHHEDGVLEIQKALEIEISKNSASDRSLKIWSDFVRGKQLLRSIRDGSHKRSVPDYLCCKITQEIMCEPVITPSGITYEKNALLRSMQIKQVDPVSKQPLYSASQLVPNLAIKAAIVEFLEKFW